MMFFLSELIWKEFYANFVQLPQSGHHNFKSAYDGIQWRNDEGGL
jgi:deoxyribodipyrimidine photo-lyase